MIDRVRPLTLRSARADVTRLVMVCVMTAILTATVQRYYDARQLSTCVVALEEAAYVVQIVMKQVEHRRCK